jgi:hypothetical protein
LNQQLENDTDDVVEKENNEFEEEKVVAVFGFICRFDAVKDPVETETRGNDKEVAAKVKEQEVRDKEEPEEEIMKVEEEKPFTILNKSLEKEKEEEEKVAFIVRV